MQSRRFLALVIAISVGHWLLYLALFSMDFALGDAGAGGFVPGLLGVVVGVLGAPLMYVLLLPLTALPSPRWWGDDSNLILGVAALNALLWGWVLAALVRRRRARRAREAA